MTKISSRGKGKKDIGPRRKRPKIINMINYLSFDNLIKK